jgi:glucose/arabinose dehydrogenase
MKSPLLLLAVALPLFTAPTPSRGGMLTGDIEVGITVEIVDVLQAPATSGSPPLARLNVLAEAPDGSGRLFVNDLRGPLYVIDGATLTTYLDFDTLFPDLKTSPGLASGFVSFAFHPDFASNGLFYTVHSEAENGSANLGPALPTTIDQHSILTEFTATIPAANGFSGSRRELMRIASPHSFHNLGKLAFDPNLLPGHPDYGLLYIGGGDFGSVAIGEPEQLQRLDTPFGTVMRIDPLGGPFLRGGTSYAYGIPAGNPYASDGDPDTFDEIFLHGVRNAHRLVWDTAGDGTLFFTDIGQGNIEELDIATGGANYGWPEREGTRALDPLIDPETVFALPPNDPSFGFRYPVAQYDHEEGSAIAGGVIVRGGQVPELEGQLLFGDIVNGRLFYADVAELEAADDGDPATTAKVYELFLRRGGTATTLLQVVDDALGNPGVSRTDLRFSRSPSGDIYLTTKQDGYIRRLVGIPPQVPALPFWLLPWAAVALAAAARITSRRTRSRRS